MYLNTMSSQWFIFIDAHLFVLHLFSSKSMILISNTVNSWIELDSHLSELFQPFSLDDNALQRPLSLTVLPLKCWPGPRTGSITVVPLSDRQWGGGAPPLYVLYLQISRVWPISVITITCWNQSTRQNKSNH